MTDRFDAGTQRRHTLGLLCAAAVRRLCRPIRMGRRTASEIRIGYQKYGTLTLLKGTRHAGAAPGRQEHRRQMDRVPGRSGPAGRPERRQHRLRHRRRSAADLRPGAGANLVYVGNEPPSPGQRGDRGAEGPPACAAWPT
jgi:sulfonate transport system substrate-binding protein